MTRAHLQNQRDQAANIWMAGVAAVDSERLVRDAISWSDETLSIAGIELSTASLNKLVVVGAGKAGTGMARGSVAAFPAEWAAEHLTGWVNVPADCVPAEPIPYVALHPARPAGLNEPTSAGVAGTEKILDLVSQLGPDDVALVLISGGGSALLPAPVSGLTLERKAELTRQLARAGADISELNAVRRTLSRVKGGGLLRACRAGLLITLIISDVVGDPLETIASGPTIDIAPDPDRALEIVTRYLGSEVAAELRPIVNRNPEQQTSSCPFHNILLGSNQVAIEAAQAAATDAGWPVESLGDRCTGIASEFGPDVIERAVRHCEQSAEGLCLLAGGETTVPMSPGVSPGKGGRNQEVALAALKRLSQCPPEIQQRITLLAGGTDGEDGPTDAAGGWADAEAIASFAQTGTDIEQHLSRHDAYPALVRNNAIWKTGPTHTNVMDLTVVLIDRA